ncbi:unnamed protein product [Caenorhabditis auriculariae]|uniref:Uncharacterized protein n=1 Tax=Caenorhabditis auriculariae TaxID=2777116 RepID=A0A8S1H422_9PELO|nr:unnamed protein product [Caenorhabditis auriculariae]
MEQRNALYYINLLEDIGDRLEELRIETLQFSSYLEVAQRRFAARPSASRLLEIFRVQKKLEALDEEFTAVNDWNEEVEEEFRWFQAREAGEDTVSDISLSELLNFSRTKKTSPSRRASRLHRAASFSADSDVDDQ